MPDVPSNVRLPAVRDCVDCGAKDGMRLQNVARTQTMSVPAHYICEHCGSTLTIPPPCSPLYPE
jgi:uncharacterized OB-fold protein